MKVGEVKVKTLDDNKGIVLFVKGDIAGDDYYYDLLVKSLRHLKFDEDYEKVLEEAAKILTVEKHKYVINRLKVKKITYPVE